MKFFRYLMAVTIAILLNTGISQAVQFEYTGGSNESMSFGYDGTTTIPTIGGAALTTNDELGIFAWREGAWSDCFGGTIVDEASDIANLVAAGFIPASFGTPALPGFNDLEEIHFKIYDASTGTTYSNVEYEGYVAFTTPQQDWDGTYTANSLIIITKINAVAPPRAPGSLSPADGAVGIATGANMNWENIIDDGWATTYDVQISTDGTTADVADVTGLTLNTYTYSGLSNGTAYQWRVRGVLTGEGAGDWSDWQTVTTKLATPALTTPANMAGGLALELTLDWESVTGAATYNYEVYSDAALTTLVTSGNEATTDVENTANGWGLANGTDYWWRVQAVNGANMSDWTAALKFTTQLGAVSLTSPADGDAPVVFNAPANTVTASWQALTGASTYEIMIASDNTFTSDLQTITGVASTTYDFTGLDSWTEYFWKVRGVDAMSNAGEWSASWSFTTDLLPAMNPNPADDAIAVDLDGDLSWGAVNGATSYDVTLATDMALANPLPGFPKNVATPTAAYTGLDFETDYYWQVEAKNATSTSTSATWKLTSRLDTPTPSSPTNGSVCNETSLDLEWIDFGIVPASGDYYNLQVSTDMNFAAGTFVGGFDGTAELTTITQTLTGLNNKSTYYWRVQAYKSSQFTGWSNTFSFETENDIVNILTPANGVSGVVKTNVTATWDSQADASSYTFEYADNPTFTGSTTVVVNNPTATIAGPLMNGQMYYWRVYSDACGADVAADAEVRSFTVQLPPANLVSPANGAIDQDLSGTLQWDAVTGAESYKVYMSTTSDFSSDVHVNATVTNNSYSYAGIENSSTHYWKVIALDEGAEGEESSVFSFETIDLAPPEQTIPVDGYAGALFTIDLNWNNYPGAVSYNVQVSTDPTFTDAGQLIVDANTGLNQYVTVTGLTYDQTVYWRTQTVTATETSNWAVPFSFTTVPEPVIIGLDDRCDNTSGIYSVTVDGNIQYTIDYSWSVTNSTINGADDAANVDVSFDTPTTAELTVTRSSAQWGTWTDSYTLDVTVNPIQPLGNTYEIMSYYEDKLCVNETLTFSAIDNEAPDTYEWYLVDGITETLLSTSPVFDYSFAASGTYEVRLDTYKPSVCGESSYSMNIVIDETCPVMLSVDDLSGCKFTPATFTTDIWGGDGNYTFSWHPSGQLNDATIEEPTVLNVLWNQNYSINVTDGNGLGTIDYAMLTVINPPTVTLKSFQLYPQSETNADLSTDLLTYISDPLATQYWYYIEGGSVYNSEDDFDYTDAPLKNPFGVRRFYMTATNADGCTSLPKYSTTFRMFSKDINEDDVVAGMSGNVVMASYPNPVVDFVNIYAEFNEESNITLKIVDLIGNETVIDNSFGLKRYQNVVDMTQFTSGVYFIVINTGNDSVVKRVIKQ